ncbi:hypothetical protein AB0F81_42390 [Actinoplanes sp. NPDC024001]|uniref:hypothetical protein n=1 Tax=Actinoplanes sp. NPDC024001 TaxID=3154598 RepID=UPI0033CD14D6
MTYPPDPPAAAQPRPGAQPNTGGQPQVPTTVARASVPVQARPAHDDTHAAGQATADPAARELTAPAVTSAPLATPSPLARPVAPDRPGGPPDGPDEAGGRERTGPSGRTSRLRIGWHAVPRAGLRGVTVTPSSGAGLLLGRDRQHSPVPLRLFGPEPVRVALVGGVWAAQLLIFRAFSVGARAIVVTSEPQAWSGFGERATGQYNRLTVLSSDQGGFPGGTAQTPTLTVYDLGVTGPATAPPLGPWHTQLTILRQLDRPGVAALQDAQLVLLQRLGGDEATLASSTLRLRPQSGQFLQFMADDMVALIGDGTERHLFLHQTGVEQQYVGLPRR